MNAQGIVYIQKAAFQNAFNVFLADVKVFHFTLENTKSNCNGFDLYSYTYSCYCTRGFAFQPLEKPIFAGF